MIPDQKIEIKTNVGLNNVYKQRYYDLGYTNVFDDDVIYVDIKHLSPKSHKQVMITCDYCGNDFLVNYNGYSGNKNKIKSKNYKDACPNCRGKKLKESMNLLYGVDAPMQLDFVKEKRDETFMKKYGTPNISSIQEIKEKKRNTYIERYGVINSSQMDTYREKFEKTCMERYGVKHPFQSEVVKEKIKATNLEKYGVENPSKNSEVVNKIIMSQKEHFGGKTSDVQVKLFEQIKSMGYKAELNYPVDNYLLDVAVFIDDIKIDIEYDGWYWHRDKQKDDARNSVLLNLGWNVIRVQSGILLPSNIEMQKCIENILNDDTRLQFIKLLDWVEYDDIIKEEI